MRMFLLALLSLSPCLALGQGYGNFNNRTGDFEWSVAVLNQSSESVGSAGGSQFEVDDAFGLGFGFGYFINEHIAVGADIEWLAPDYTATLVDDNGDTSRFDHELTQMNFRFKGTYLFLEGPFNPYIELGAGWTYVDSNVADGPPITGCWWHPWFGYICNSYYDTFDETEFSYGGAVGLRYQLTGGMIMKLSYNNYEIDASGDIPEPTLNAIRFELAWPF